MRTKPLTGEEIVRYEDDGFVYPIRIMSEADALVLRDAIEEHLGGSRESERYELTDPIKVRAVEPGDGKRVYEYDESDNTEQPHTIPFLFNLWKWDDRFAAVGHNSLLAGMARQLLNCRQVLLFEDNAVIKKPRSGVLPWHQDYSYWPLGGPTAITVWIALDPVDATNGAMQIVPGSHKWGERLPVSFGDARTFMKESRPEMKDVPQDPEARGLPIETYKLAPGECGFHHPLVWHGSTANDSAESRRAFVLRYVADGSVWLGSERIPYHDIGCANGGRLNSTHFPPVDAAF